MLTTARLLFHTYRLARDPESTQDAFAIIDNIVLKASPEQLNFFEEELLRDSAFREMYETRDDGLIKGVYDIDALSRLPHNTLGYVYAAHMRERNLVPDFYKGIPGRNILRFLRNRLSKTHDVWHVLGGFDTSVPGELGLQAFYGGQIPSITFMAIILSGFLRTLYLQDNRLGKDIFDSISQGYMAGKKAQKLFGIKWEDYWEEDLGEIRRKFNIQIPREA